MDWTQNRPRLLAAAGIIALIALAGLGTSQIGRMIEALEWVRSAGPSGYAVFAGVYLVATLLLAPASFLQGAAGFLLGPLWGFVAASAGSVLCGAVSFLLARTVLRDVVAHRVSRDPRFILVDEAIGDGGAYLVGLLRLSPISPFNVMNYALGLTTVRLRDYLLGTWLGSLPAVLLYSYIGSTVGSLAEILDGGAARDLGPQLVVLVCTLVATALVMRYAQRALGHALAPE